MQRFMSWLLPLTLFPLIGGAVEHRVLGNEVLGHPPQEMMRHYLNDLAQPFFKERAARFEALETAEDVAAYQERQREFFVEALGGFPERTPLNPRIVGGGEGDDYRYEKVIFESLPNFPVTATLYLPKTEPPYPGVIVPCGHDPEGKAGKTYQRASILLAQNGIAALTYDPVGQGERYDFFNEDGSPAYDATVHHSLMNVGAILTGTNIAMYHIWDGMRALDYLEGRPEVDAERLGCTGNSGGGTVTAYLMALDPRIKVAAPSCYITSFPRLLATIGPQDAEQNIYGQIAFGMDHADFLHMRAPLPTLICAATRDFFDIQGTWGTYREAKRLYTKLGAPEHVSLIEVDAEHGFSQPLREGMVRWMRRWLLDIDAPVREPEIAVRTPEELWCTPKGQVAFLPGTISVFDLNAARERELSERRKVWWAGASDEERRAKVREVARVGVDWPRLVNLERHARQNREGYAVEKITLNLQRHGERQPYLILPSYLFTPEQTPHEAVLYLHGRSSALDAGPGGPIEALVREDQLVLALDLRGIGETEGADYPEGPWTFVGQDWPDTARAYLLNRTIVGMRADDVESGAGALSNQFVTLTGVLTPENPIMPSPPVALVAIGEATVPALHAAVLFPEHFSQVTLRGGIPSWAAVVHEPRAKDQLVNTVHGALAWYDLPDLVEMLGDKVEVVRDVPTF